MSSVERFVEELGLISQENGDTRISGRIVGLLLVEGHELSLNQISERLGVSRASVSTNARMLARRGVIRLTPHSGNRQDYYALSAMPFFDILDDVADRFSRQSETIARCVDVMREENPAAAERAAGLTSFFEQSAIVLRDWSNTLRTEAPGKKDQQ